MERRGSGFKKIIGDYRNQPNYEEAKEPKFYSDNDLFILVLKNLNYEEKRAIKTNGKKQMIPKDDTNDTNQKKLLELIKDNPKITQVQLKDELDISIISVKRMMAEMQTKGIIKRKGLSRRGEWIIL